MNLKYILIVLIFTIIDGGWTLWFSIVEELPPVTEVSKIKKPDPPKLLSDSQHFSNLCIKFVREVAENYFDGKSLQYPA